MANLAYLAEKVSEGYHTISNLKIQTGESLTGLFAGLGGTQTPPPGDGGDSIQHLFVTNGNITSSGLGAGGIVGAIAGDALVYQCGFSGTISINNNDQFCGAEGFLLYEASDITAHSAKLSANIHPGNTTFSRAYFFYDNIESTDYHEVETETDGYVEVIIENIEPQLVTIYSLDGKIIKTIENSNIIDVQDLNEGI